MVLGADQVGRAGGSDLRVGGRTRAHKTGLFTKKQKHQFAHVRESIWKKRATFFECWHFSACFWSGLTISSAKRLLLHRLEPVRSKPLRSGRRVSDSLRDRTLKFDFKSFHEQTPGRRDPDPPAWDGGTSLRRALQGSTPVSFLGPRYGPCPFGGHVMKAFSRHIFGTPQPSVSSNSFLCAQVVSGSCRIPKSLPFSLFS